MTASKRPRKTPQKCNVLGGKKWLRNSISVWSDIRKTPEEARLKHPAMFPTALVERLIETFMPPAGRIVLDPFCGSGSTLVAAEQAGKQGVGIELSREYIALAKSRLQRLDLDHKTTSRIHHVSASDLTTKVAADSIDLCVTSPPYWNILNQKRTADYKSVRNYGNNIGDLGIISDYDEFLLALQKVFSEVYQVLKAGAYCCVVVMDLRKKNRFYPFHSELAARLQEFGFIYDDLIIWNRQSEYNNLRPLGYPSVFRVNKVHEFILLFQKPRDAHSKTKRV